MNTGTRKTTKASTTKKPATATAKAPAAPAKKAAAPAQKTATAVATKAPAKLPAKKTPALAPAKRASKHEVMLARVESVRLSQRTEGHFDCFGRAAQGFCDQGDCAYHAECLSISGMLHSI
jgi:hypothetical protein